MQPLMLPATSKKPLAPYSLIASFRHSLNLSYMIKEAILTWIPFIDATKGQLTLKAILANKLSLETTNSLA
jgi:hypothetical protein